MKTIGYIDLKNIHQELLDRHNWIKDIIAKSSLAIDKAPRGSLLMAKSHNTSQFYRVNDSAHNNDRTYLSKSNRLINQLASKRYNQSVLMVASKEQEWIDATLASMPNKFIEDVYADNPELRKLVTPYYMTDEEFVNYWRSKTYESNSLFKEKAIFLTENNEMVRSKSEKIIADKLLKLNIPYKYECPLPLNGKVVYPDFRLLNVARRKEIIHEHFGMMDNPEYVQRAITKINEYARNGILIGDRLIATFETTDGGLDIKAYEKMLEKYVLQ